MNSPLAQKLWRLSQIFNCSPWDDTILNMSYPRMDFILSNYAAENPDKMAYNKGGATSELEGLVSVNKGWADRLLGKAKETFKSKVTFKLPEQYTTKPKIQRFDKPKAPKS